MLQLYEKKVKQGSSQAVSMLPSTCVYTTEQKWIHIAILTIDGTLLGGGTISPKKKNNFYRKKAANKARMNTGYWHEFNCMQDTHDKHEIHTELQFNLDLAKTDSGQHHTSTSPSYHASIKL